MLTWDSHFVCDGCVHTWATPGRAYHCPKCGDLHPREAANAADAVNLSRIIRDRKAR